MAVALAGLAIRFAPPDRRAGALPDSEPGAVATAGTVLDPDSATLIGRRVSVTLPGPASRYLSDVAFWVGPAGDRLLAVLARDDRDGVIRQRVKAASTDLGAMTDASAVTVSGTLQRLPAVEEMSSWGLTNEDRDELRRRGLYVRIDRIEELARQAPASR